MPLPCLLAVGSLVREEITLDVSRSSPFCHGRFSHHLSPRECLKMVEPLQPSASHERHRCEQPKFTVQEDLFQPAEQNIQTFLEKKSENA